MELSIEREIDIINYDELTKNIVEDREYFRNLFRNDFVLDNVNTIGKALYIKDIFNDLNIESYLYVNNSADKVIYILEKDMAYYAYKKDNEYVYIDEEGDVQEFSLN